MHKPIKPVYIKRLVELNRGTGVKFEDYAINITPLPKDEGEGYLVTIPDLPGCIADSETIDDAVAEARGASNAWMIVEVEDNGELPAPRAYSGQFVQRIPKTLHMRLAKRAASEGVARINSLRRSLRENSPNAESGRAYPHLADPRAEHGHGGSRARIFQWKTQSPTQP